VQAEAQGQPPAEPRGKCGFGGVNEHAAPLEGEKAPALCTTDAQFESKLVLGVRLFGFQAHAKSDDAIVTFLG
jgi:hypothetical protein